MKLIAETRKENEQLYGLAALLCDLGVDVDSYEQEEAIAVAFWNANDCVPIPERLAAMPSYERAAFLCSIEDMLRTAMLTAGYHTIEQALDRAEAGRRPDFSVSCS